MHRNTTPLTGAVGAGTARGAVPEFAGPGYFGAGAACPAGRPIPSSMRESMNGKNGFADMRISESSETISVPVSPRSAIAPRFTP